MMPACFLQEYRHDSSHSFIHSFIPVVALSLLTAASIPAATITPTAFTSDALKAAIASAAEGDVVDLSGFSGTLTVGEVLFPAVSMTVRGPADQSVVLKTSIASGSKGHCVFATSDAGVTLTLENLVFRDNITGGWGSQATDNDDRAPGVIRTTGPLVLKNCVFADNKTIKDEKRTSRYCSANVWSAGGLSATDCTFSGAFDNRDNSWDYYGEVMLLDGGSVGITNCVFSGNGWTGQSVGNIACFDTTDVSLVGCTFTNNLSQGGSALLTVMNGPVVVKDCIFRNCQSCYGKNNMNIPAHGTLNSSQSTVYGNAGALWFAKGSQQVVVENCEFTDCSSYSSSNGTGGNSARGGAIGWRAGSSGSRIVVANSTFYHCYSGDVGGALESDISYPMYFVNCTMAACGAAGNGSAVFQNKGDIRFLNTMLAYNWKANAATANDWYAGTTRYGWSSWTHETHWGTYDNGKSADVVLYARDYPLKSTAAYDATSYGGVGDPYAEWTASTDFASVRTSKGNFSTDRTKANTGAGPVPVLNADAKRSRVVEIAEGGPLDAKGYYVKHSADWSSIAYSKDGTSWSAMLGSKDAATLPLAADQRGVAYRTDSATGLPKAPIGAATVENAAGTLLLFY